MNASAASPVIVKPQCLGNSNFYSPTFIAGINLPLFNFLKYFQTEHLEQIIDVVACLC
jgi:hypothetical protein